MPVESTLTASRARTADLAKTVQPFTCPDSKKAIWQIINDVPVLQEVKPLTFLASLRCARLHIRDERSQMLTGYRGPTG